PDRRVGRSDPGDPGARAAPQRRRARPGRNLLRRRPGRRAAPGSVSGRFEHVLVVGAGQMGGGIAQVIAASGRRVSLYDSAPGAVDRGLEAMRKSLAKLAEKGGAAPEEVLARVDPVEDLVPAELMIEAVVEDAAVKEEIFRRADGVLPPEAILASNTS